MTTPAPPAAASLADAPLPRWADELRRRYLRGEAWQFVLHGNVHDLNLVGGRLYTLSELLAQVLLERSKDTVILYNVSTGVRFGKRKMSIDGFEELILSKEPAKVLPLIERALTTEDRVAVVLEYADTIAPASDTSFSTVDDRAAVVALHRWSLLGALEKADSVVILTVENLSELNAKLVSNPRVGTVHVPMPNKAERAALIAHIDPELAPDDRDRLAEITAGLKLIQIRSIIGTAEVPDLGGDKDERNKYLLDLLSPDAPPTAATLERADKLSQMTQGMHQRGHPQVDRARRQARRPRRPKTTRARKSIAWWQRANARSSSANAPGSSSSSSRSTASTSSAAWTR